MEKEYEELFEKMADYWNTRIIKHNIKGFYNNGVEYNETYYGVHEVYYDKQGKPIMWTENPIRLTFQDKEEFEILLKQILDANSRPVLELDEENNKLIEEGEK